MRLPAVTLALASSSQLATMKSVAATLFIVGGFTGATGVVITQSTPFSKATEAAMSAALVGIGLVVLLAPANRRLIEAAMLSSIVILSASMALLDPVGMMPFFFLWPIVFAAYFCSQRMLIAATTLMAVGVTAAVTVNATIVTKLDTVEGTVVSVGLMGALVALMQHRERRLTYELELAARSDPLTGLLNRRVFNPALDQLVEGSRNTGAPVAVVLLDLDHFKRFNDRFGHVEGDLALQRLAAALTAEASADDCIGRLGGEEFGVVIPGATTADGLEFARRVAARLASEAVDPDRRLSASCGVCASDLASGITSGEMIARADQALYAAKAGGRRMAAWWNGRGISLDQRHLIRSGAA